MPKASDTWAPGTSMPKASDTWAPGTSMVVIRPRRQRPVEGGARRAYASIPCPSPLPRLGERAHRPVFAPATPADRSGEPTGELMRRVGEGGGNAQAKRCRAVQPLAWGSERRGQVVGGEQMVRSGVNRAQEARCAGVAKRLMSVPFLRHEVAHCE